MGGPSPTKAHHDMISNALRALRTKDSGSEQSILSSVPSTALSQATKTSGHSQLTSSSKSTDPSSNTEPQIVSLEGQVVHHYTIICDIRYGSASERSQIKRALNQHVMQYIQNTYDTSFAPMGNSAFVTSQDLALDTKSLSTQILFRSQTPQSAGVTWKTIVPDRKENKDAPSLHIAFEHFQESRYDDQDEKICTVMFDMRRIHSQQLSTLATSSTPFNQSDMLKILNAFTIFKLSNAMREASEVVTSIHCNKAFGESTSTSTGCDVRAGRQGRIIFDQHGQASVSWSECTGRFYRDILVCDFLAQHFSAPVVAKGSLDEDEIKKANNILHGVKVIVAVASKSQKQVYTINNLISSARSTPHALHGLARNIAVDDLTYPDLPCINVGTEARPFLFPVEVCKIMPNQKFRHPAPISAANAVFDLRAPRYPEPEVGRVHRNRGYATFPHIGKDEFRLFFLHVHGEDMADEKGANRNILSSLAWTQLKSAMGSRFGNKLHAAIHYGKADVCHGEDSAAICSSIRHLVATETKGKKVLILGIPTTLNSSCLAAIRKYCDIELGIHCVAVNAREVQSRFVSASVSKDMVKYTGQLVRKILAQAMYQPLADGPDRPAQFVGVHINEIQHNIRLVSIVVLSSEKFTRTSHHLLDASDLMTFFTRIAEEIREMCDLSKLPTVVFQFIPEAIDDVYQRDGIPTVQLETLMEHNPDAALSLINFSQDHLVALSEDCFYLEATPATHIPSGNSGQKITQQMHDMMKRIPNAEDTLINVYQYTSHASNKPFHVSYRFPLQVSGTSRNSSHLKFEYFSKRPLPVMLHLARKASSRARIYLEKSDDNLVQLVDQKIHPNLKNTLYFL